MHVSESKTAIIKWEIVKILEIGIHIIFLWKPNKKNQNNGQIPLSLTTVSPCKHEYKILMIVSLYSDAQKLRFN